MPLDEDTFRIPLPIFWCTICNLWPVVSWHCLSDHHHNHNHNHLLRNLLMKSEWGKQSRSRRRRWRRGNLEKLFHSLLHPQTGNQVDDEITIEWRSEEEENRSAFCNKEKRGRERKESKFLGANKKRCFFTIFSTSLQLIFFFSSSLHHHICHLNEFSCLHLLMMLFADNLSLFGRRWRWAEIGEEGRGKNEKMEKILVNHFFLPVYLQNPIKLRNKFLPSFLFQSRAHLIPPSNHPSILLLHWTCVCSTCNKSSDRKICSTFLFLSFPGVYSPLITFCLLPVQQNVILSDLMNSLRENAASTIDCRSIFSQIERMANSRKLLLAPDPISNGCRNQTIIYHPIHVSFCSFLSLDSFFILFLFHCICLILFLSIFAPVCNNVQLPSFLSSSFVCSSLLLTWIERMESNERERSWEWARKVSEQTRWKESKERKWGGSWIGGGRVGRSNVLPWF